MSRQRTFSLPLCLSLAALSTGPASAGQAADGASALMSRDPRDGVRVSTPRLARPLRQAVLGADAWLEKPACQELFDEFRDQQGVPLAAVLAERGRDAREQLRSILFYDGTDHPACRAGSGAAVSSPGGLVVFVCPRFGRYAEEIPRARAIVVHELLHTLGLGENPPTSEQITNRVLQRCAR